MREVTAVIGRQIFIGKTGENNATLVKFPVVKKFIDLYGEGTYQLLFKRGEGDYEQTSYPCEVTTDEKNVNWIITSEELEVPGLAQCELRYLVSNTIAKSITYICLINSSVEDIPQKDWYDKVLDVAEDIKLLQPEVLEAAAMVENMTASAEITSDGGDPKVLVEKTPVDDHYNFNFKFYNVGSGSSNAAHVVQKVKDYLYYMDCNSVNYDIEPKDFPPAPNGFGCSSVHKGNFYGRNFDWYYDDKATFIINRKATQNKYASIGVSGMFLTKEQAESGEDSPLYDYLPLVTLDGINSNGVICSTNILPFEDKKGTITGTLEGGINVPTLYLVRRILDEAKSAQDAIYKIQNVYNIYEPELETFKFAVHYMIADKNDTFVVEFNGNEIVVLDEFVWDKPIMTNFYLMGAEAEDESTFDIDTLTPHSEGIERAEILASLYDNINSVQTMIDAMSEAQFTKAYSYDNLYGWPWASEFYGIYEDYGDINVYSGWEEVEPIYEIAKLRFDNRDRLIPDSWQTVHSSVYDIENRTLNIKVQEEREVFVFNCEKFQELPYPEGPKERSTYEIEWDGQQTEIFIPLSGFPAALCKVSDMMPSCDDLFEGGYVDLYTSTRPMEHIYPLNDDFDIEFSLNEFTSLMYGSVVVCYSPGTYYIDGLEEEIEFSSNGTYFLTWENQDDQYEYVNKIVFETSSPVEKPTYKGTNFVEKISREDIDETWIEVKELAAFVKIADPSELEGRFQSISATFSIDGEIQEISCQIEPIEQDVYAGLIVDENGNPVGYIAVGDYEHYIPYSPAGWYQMENGIYLYFYEQKPSNNEFRPLNITITLEGGRQFYFEYPEDDTDSFKVTFTDMSRSMKLIPSFGVDQVLMNGQLVLTNGTYSLANPEDPIEIEIDENDFSIYYGPSETPICGYYYSCVGVSMREDGQRSSFISISKKSEEPPAPAGEKVVSFTIFDTSEGFIPKTFVCPQMTWREFCNSSYNDYYGYKFKVSESRSYIEIIGCDYCTLQKWEANVNPNDAIIHNAYYNIDIGGEIE